VGDEVLVKANSSDEEMKAVIKAIEPQINSSTRNVKIRAYLAKGTIFPGTFVKVSLIENKEAIAVPSSAVIPDALSNQLAIVKNGKSVFKNVETGSRNADMIEIKSGINPGDSVIVSGVLFVRAGAKVAVKNKSKVKSEK
jgi:membrane fusion protein (multidrug efflux system)